ncbi:MAG: HD domain-containing protein [Spirochaetota bacterium]
MDTCLDQFQLIFKALQFAAEKHTGQRRKNIERSPYINHPIAVAFYLSTFGGINDHRILTAAILHDTLEDTDTTEEELEKNFGLEILNLVKEVTDDKKLSKELRKQLQIVHARGISAGAKNIKLADKISNITDIMNAPPALWTYKRKTEYLNWTERVVKELSGTNGALEKLYFDRLSEARSSLRL